MAKKESPNRNLRRDEEAAMDPIGWFDSTDDLGKLKWINLLAFCVNVVVTYGIGVAGLFGFSTNTQVSSNYPSLLTPASWAFIIWGVIFATQGLWVLQQFLVYCNLLPKAVVQAIVKVNCNYVFVVMAQISWTVVFGREWIAVAAFVITVLSSNLYVLVRSLDEQKVGILWYFTTIFPFTLHFGWVTAATIVNWNLVIVAQRYGATVEFWAAIGSVAVLVLVSAWLTLRLRYVLAPAIIAYALAAIVVELWLNYPLGQYDEQQQLIVRYAALGAGGTIALMALVSAVRQILSPRKAETNVVSASAYHRYQDGGRR